MPKKWLLVFANFRKEFTNFHVDQKNQEFLQFCPDQDWAWMKEMPGPYAKLLREVWEQIRWKDAGVWDSGE